jgi:hypothetical protein
MRHTLFLAGYAICQLDAFAFAGVPLAWLGLGLYAAASIGHRRMPYSGLIAGVLVLTLLLAVTTLVRGLDTAPAGYIAIRLFSMVAFLLVVNHVAVHARGPAYASRFEGKVAAIGGAAAAVAIGVYVVHTSGWGDLPRNLLGTGGLIQAITSTSELGTESHRALGAFREPSFLAL